jgi:hypothetical protein
MFGNKEKKLQKLKEKISKLEGEVGTKNIPKTKMGIIKKIILGSGAYGGIKEAAEQLATGDMSLKDLLMGVITGPRTVAKDAIEYMQDDKKKREGMATGGMAEMRKKGMGLKMANGGEASFPDLTGDGKVTQKDILRGRKVPGFKGGGTVKKRVVKRKPKSRGTGAAVRGTKFKGVF